MKKTLLVAGVLVSSLAMAEKFVVEPYVNFNLAQSAKTKVFSHDIAKLKRGYGLGVEGRVEVVKGLELGAGLAFEGAEVNRKKVLNELKDEDSYAVIETRGLLSIPLYLVGKYNFDLGNEVKPYVKTKLGYSINTYSIKFKESHSTFNYELNQKGQNSLYFGLGTGIEFNNLNIGLSYDINNFKVKENDVYESNTVKDKDSGSHKVKNRTLKLNVGYAFKF